MAPKSRHQVISPKGNKRSLTVILTRSNKVVFTRDLQSWHEILPIQRLVQRETKTEPLATTKTPSYKVTYDDNDDLTVVYEEFSGYELPASTNQFGFVDEATNKLIAPDQVQMKYNLTLNENNKNSNEQ